MGGVGIALHGCISMDSLSSDSVKNFTSPQELIAQKILIMQMVKQRNMFMIGGRSKAIMKPNPYIQENI